jgi:hypothetical protein
MAEMAAYAASLTNAGGKILSPETIVASKWNEVRKLDTGHGRKQPAQRFKGKKSGRAMVQEEVAQEQANKEKKRAEGAISAWQKCVADVINPIPDHQKRYLRLIAYYDEKVERKGIDAIIPELNLYKLSTLVQIWSEYCKASKKGDGYHVAAQILVLVEKLAKSEIECPTGTSAILREMAKRIGFVLPSISFQEGPPLTFPFSFEKSASLELGMKSQDFSLLHVGPYFDRNMDSHEDRRVRFRPDGWQIRVLDLLDKKSSLLVVAPTSSGKTFISFYA